MSRMVLTTGLVALLASQTDELQLNPGTVLPIVIRRLQGESPDVPLTHTLQVVIPARGRFVVWACSTDSDPSLRLESADHTQLAHDEDSGGGTTAVIVRDADGPESATLVVLAGSGAAAQVVLEARFVEEDETAQSTARAARTRLEAIATRLGAQDGAGARTECVQAIDELLANPRGVASPSICDALWELGRAALKARDPGTAIRAFDPVLKMRERTLPPQHPDLARVLGNLGLAHRQLGAFERARECDVRALAIFEAALPEDHPLLASARLNLADTLQEVGEYESARALLEQVVVLRERTLGAEDPSLAGARLNLSTVLEKLGETERALELARAAYRVLSRVLEEGHPGLQSARLSLGGLLLLTGDALAARPLLEAAVAGYVSSEPADDLDIWRAEGTLAFCRFVLGDVEGALILQDQIVAGFERHLGLGARDLAIEHYNRAQSLIRLGRLEEALSEFESLVASAGTSARGSHISDLDARHSALLLRTRLGRSAASDPEFDALDVAFRSWPEDALGRQRWRETRAWCLQLRGDEPAAMCELEALLAARVDRDGSSSEEALATRNLLTRSLVRLGQPERAVEMALTEVREARHEIARQAAASSPRESSVLAPTLAAYVHFTLSVGRGLGEFERPAALDQACFLALEELRSLAIVSAGRQRRALSTPALQERRASVRRATRTLVHEAGEGQSPDHLQRARSALDAAQRALESDLGASEASSSSQGALDLTTLRARLDEDEALISYVQYARFGPSVAPSRQGVEAKNHLLAFVLRRTQGLRRVDLGPFEPVSQAVQAWRGALLAATPQVPARGVAPGPASSDKESELHLGQRLGALVLDPLRALLTGVHKVVLLPDLELHDVPFDALPQGAGRCGDAWTFELLASLRGWRVAGTPVLPDGGLLAVGDVDYALATTPHGADAPVPGGNAVAHAGTTITPSGQFAPLPATRDEVRSLAEIWASARPDEAPARLLVGPEPTRGLLELAAPHARWLHIATHGWFAPTAGGGRIERNDAGGLEVVGTADSSLRSVANLSPLLLCGLALAGADRGEEGRITAEELASWNLSGCEVATLSACDTNVGVQDVGQGTASLQMALHMAGARNVVASLWRVPDEATAELMREFYRRMWIEHEPVARALWNAKCALRAAGQPPRDWAGWTLSVSWGA